MILESGQTMPNEVTGANAGKRAGFAGKSRVGFSPWPGVAQFRRSAILRVCPEQAVL